MWDVKELFVMSDLHLAAERNAGLFQSDIELADCLNWILKESSDSLTVLAGDILDFLVLRNGDSNGDHARVDFEGLGNRTQEIIKHHPEVFEALGKLARSPRHQLVIMGGNHDPELIFPAVQETIERRLGGGDFSKPVLRWLVQGEALRLRIGKAVVLVEHGNILDPWNRINHAALQGALSLSSRNLSDVSDYQPPPGSRLVLKVVSQLRDQYTWVDCLKPETEAVLPLLWHFASLQQRKLIFDLADDYLSMKVFALNQKIGNARNPERLYKNGKEAESSPKDKVFKEWVDALHEPQPLTLGPDKKENKLITKLRMVSAQDSFFDHEELGDPAKYLEPLFNGGADLVIHGHTHSAKACVVEGGLYLNTGTWGQLLRLPKSDEGDEAWQDFIGRLRTNGVSYFRRPTFTRVRHSPQQDVTTAALLEWQQPHPKILSTRQFSDRQTGWRKGS
jgi:UDP-2,3-diacylglucosamine pyrophosphatase LpxH